MKSIKQRRRRRIGEDFTFATVFGEKVDKDVHTLFFPLNLMQIIVLNPKYRIKNHFISPNNCFNKIIIFCAMMAYLSAYVYRVLEISFDPNFRRYVTITFLYSASYFDFIFYSMGFVLNCVLNISKTKKMVTFVLTFQEVHKVIKNEDFYKWSVMRCWIHVVLIWSYYIFTFIFMCLAPWHIVFNLLVILSLDVNLIYAIVLIELLRDKVQLWNLEVKNLPTDDSNDEHSIKMFEVYVNLLKCYKIVKNVFELQVSRIFELNCFYGLCYRNFIYFHQFIQYNYFRFFIRLSRPSSVA